MSNGQRFPFVGEIKSLAWRPASAIVAITLVACSFGRPLDGAAPNVSTALANALVHDGLVADPNDIQWEHGASGLGGALFGGASAIVRAHHPGEPNDLYLVEARLSPEGSLLAVGGNYNLTHTTGADETKPVLSPRSPRASAIIAYCTVVDGLYTSIHTIDLGGESAERYADFTRLQKWQIALSNLQQTGRTRGVIHNTFALDPVSNSVRLGFSERATIDAVSDGTTFTINPESATSTLPGVRISKGEKATPQGLIQWSVDRVRAMPWFGEDKMQYVKAIAFTGLAIVKDAKSKVFGESAEPEEELKAPSGTSAPTYIDPEIGWPPPPLVPPFKPSGVGEGQWVSLEGDPFITQNPGVPSPFVTTYVRADREKQAIRVYITEWDPRQIALHMQAGTVEPVSATGAAGPGVIPRTPEVMKRVVGGFNGGFQATHGEYGMQANGVLYLPPKPYAATVMEMRDGTTAFGSWPGKSDVPDDVLSFRQNMTALVERGKWNPWGRTWWGGTPPGWHDRINTTRSGVCLTEEKFVAYFFGNEIPPEALAKAMITARCSYGVHLDMNPGLAGFEFYNAAPTAEFVPLGRPLQSDWEYEGTLRDLPDFKFRARRMLRHMGHINFPQYIHRDGRDFFYLTARPVLPGGPIPSAEDRPKEPGEAAWRVKGLPQHGFPYAIAIGWVRPDPRHAGMKVRVMRVDPRTIAATNGTANQNVVATLGVPETKAADAHATSNMGDLRLWFTPGVFTIGKNPHDEKATAIAYGVLQQSSAAQSARAAVGIQDEDGMLNWVEIPATMSLDAEGVRQIDQLLQKMGCGSRMFVPGQLRAFVGGELGIDAESPTPHSTLVSFTRVATPGAELHFTDTPIVPFNVWQPLQAQRVRYFPKPTPKASASAATKPAPANE